MIEKIREDFLIAYCLTTMVIFMIGIMAILDEGMKATNDLMTMLVCLWGIMFLIVVITLLLHSAIQCLQSWWNDLFSNPQT